jgi:Flp pilus assembly protein TadG
MSLPVMGGRSARSRARSDHGQATVELALVLPLVFGMLMLLFQIALVARDEILVVHAARDAAREATVTRDPARVIAAARRDLPGATVRIVRRGRVSEPVEVAITYVSRTALPLVGAVVPDLTLHAGSVMRAETP